MKVANMKSTKGHKVQNQFVITDLEFVIGGEVHIGRMFQSYDTCIAFVNSNDIVFLDAHKWDYSYTTGKYRNQFLGETKAQTQAKIARGEYILMNLN